MSRPRPRPTRVLACLAAWTIAGALALAPTPSALAQARRPPFGQGTHAFRHILDRLKLEPLTGFDQLARDPQQTLLIVFGNTSPLTQVPGGVEEFTSQGGSVIVATDRPPGDFTGKAGWLKLLTGKGGLFGVGVAGAAVTTDDEDEMYRGNLPKCPVVTDADFRRFTPPLRGVPQRPSPLFKGVSRIATNCPSYLRATRARENDEASTGLAKLLGDLSVLAQLPEGCKAGLRGGEDDKLPFAAGRGAPFTPGDFKGRFLIVSDHSVFINDMMLQTDNDNFVFAYNCVEWLGEGRTHVLFLDEGNLVTDFKVPLKELPPIPMPPPEFFNKVIEEVETKNILNDEILARVPRSQILQGWAVGLTAALVGYGLFRLMRARHLADAQVPLSPSVNRVAPAAAAEQRFQAMVQDGNLWEAAREVARECFAAPTSAGERLVDHLAVPRIQAAGGWWRRWVLRNRVWRLWQLAHDPLPRHVSPREFAAVVAHSAEVKAAVGDGSLRLEGPSGG